MPLPPPPPGVPIRRVRFKEGRPIPGRTVYELPKWNGMGDKKRVAYLRKLIKQYGRDPRLREVAIQIIKEAGAPPRDYEAQAAALLRWVNQNIYYVNEPSELLQSAQRTLECRSGDCDDCHILLASLAESIRLPWRTVLSGNKNGKRVRWIEDTPMPPGVKWAHIYTLLGWPPFRPQKWMLADPSLKNSYLGWDIVNAPHMPAVPGAPPEAMPEMGGVNYSGYHALVTNPAVQAVASDSPATEREIEEVVEAAKREAFWKSIKWGDVWSNTLPTVLSAIILALILKKKGR